MTENDKRALKLISDNGGTLRTYCSGVGGLLYPTPKNRREGAPDNRRAQGLALAGAKAMRRLEQQGLITIRGVWDSSENIYQLTKKGREFSQ